MYTALLITPAGDVQEISVFTQSAINAILRDPSVDCLTSSDGVIDFWFRSAVPGRYRPNRQATGLLLSVTTSAKLTPERQEQLRRLAGTGEPVPELAQAFGISRATAYRYLAKPSSPSGVA